MKFLTVTANGQPEMRTKAHYGGEVTGSQFIKKTGNVLITGAHHSGKSSIINRLYDEAEEIWFNQVKPYSYTNNRANLSNDKPMLKKGETLENWQFPEPVLISGITPLSKWTEHAGVKAWFEAKGEEEYKKIPAWKRVELLPQYLKETRAILLVDDAHRLTGRKLQIVKECIAAAFRVILSASDENKLAPNIRRQFLETKPQIVRLNSEVAYDATHLLVWFIVMVCFLTGQTEIGAVLGMLETMKGGRRSSRQD
jgi:GTPase SAR1 family protein